MALDELKIPINLENGDKTHLYLISEQESRLVQVEESIAKENNEAEYQLYEGSTYEYSLDGEYSLEGPGRVVKDSKLNSSSGRLVPNTYVGTLNLSICNFDGEYLGEIQLEVRSIKTDYRSEYRLMLKEIAEHSTELLLQYTSPVAQHFTIDYSEDAATLYQRFAFVKSILESREFEEAVFRILSSPHTAWKKTRENKDIRSIGRTNRSVIRQLIQPGNRMKLPETHSLRNKIGSVPKKVIGTSKEDTIDTPENRFIKYALSSFTKLCGDFKLASTKGHRLFKEAENLESKLEEILARDFFSDISQPQTLPLNSPTLQRREGYREVLKSWLMLNLAAMLTWEGGEDVYSGNKRDVASLYEYWVFFKLLEIVENVFEVDSIPINNLMEVSRDKLTLKLKKGQYIPLKGTCEKYSRKFNVELSFNKHFSGSKKYPEAGSWSSPMRPDYTLSLWPDPLSKRQAEHEELIIHVHFDAKYKIKNLTSLYDLGAESEDDIESSSEDRTFDNRFKRADLLKMHAYKDAIRRTSGAYVLYPGDINQQVQGFHEVVPGLGAFTLKPSEKSDGSKELRHFLKDVLNHFLNRTSQREKISFYKYDTYKSKPSKPLRVKTPDTFGKDRSMIPDLTNVLVGKYKNKSHLVWIDEMMIYNAVLYDGSTSLNIGKEIATARYLLLYTEEELTSSILYRISDIPPKFISANQLSNMGYQDTDYDYYLKFELLPADLNSFDTSGWNIPSLPTYKEQSNTDLPFVINLETLARAKL